jgi:hypothetical protein
MASDNPFALPANAFVFFMHQGYQFMYILCDGASEDPPVYHYLEYESAAKVVYQRFTAWMEDCAKQKRDE